MYYEIYRILYDDLELASGAFGELFCSLFSTCLCAFVVLIPFIIVYLIIKGCLL